MWFLYPRGGESTVGLQYVAYIGDMKRRVGTEPNLVSLMMPRSDRGFLIDFTIDAEFTSIWKHFMNAIMHKTMTANTTGGRGLLGMRACMLNYAGSVTISKYMHGE